MTDEMALTFRSNGRHYGTAKAVSPDTIFLRLDDEGDPAWWAQFAITADQIKRLTEDARRKYAAACSPLSLTPAGGRGEPYCRAEATDLGTVVFSVGCEKSGSRRCQFVASAYELGKWGKMIENWAPECVGCGERLDKGCDGRPRCPACDGPCPGCSDQ